MLSKVLVLRSDGHGGINRLFQELDGALGRRSGGMELFDSFDARPGKWIRFPFRIILYVLKLFQAKPDLIHINISVKGSTLRKAIYAMLATLLRKKYILHLHGGGYVDFFSSLRPSGKLVVKALFNSAEKIIVLGQVWSDFVVHSIGVDPYDVIILENAIYAPEKLPARGQSVRPRILFLGRLSTLKGVPELIDALCSKRLRNLCWDSLFAGDGNAEHFMDKLSYHGLADRVTFCGWLDAEQVREALSKSDILVLPSHVENLPLLLLEGMGYGLCPVVTPVGAIPEVICHARNGLVVPVNDAGALADALANLIESPMLRSRLAEQARADYEKYYDIRDYRAKLEAIYTIAITEE